MKDKLILLKRTSYSGSKTYIYEVHIGEIEQTKNLLFTLNDEGIAQKIVDRYNQLEK